MVRNQKTLTKLGIIVGIMTIFVGLLSLLSGVAGSGNGGIGDIIQPKDQVQCNVELKDFLIGDAEIQSASCFKTGSSCYLSIAPFSLTKVEGELLMQASDDSHRETYSIGRLQGNAVLTGNLCTDDTTISITLKNDNGQVVDSEVATVQ